jgi:hypothetical protein
MSTKNAPPVARISRIGRPPPTEHVIEVGKPGAKNKSRAVTPPEK